jgi:hypothetical protein
VANYLVLYTGGMGMAADEADQQRIMGEWNAWYGRMGEAIVDGGAPFGAAKHVAGNGIEDGPLGDNPATGYTVIRADSLEAAAAACEDHPHLKDNGQVQVFECIDLSGQG